MTAEQLIAGLALIGIVIIVSALLSGLVDRSGLPWVAVFIFIGAALGPFGLGVFNMQLESPVLRVAATRRTGDSSCMLKTPSPKGPRAAPMKIKTATHGRPLRSTSPDSS